ncbi:hypothetical protein P691DRAFT_197029 [Macrolepiota fuliginosa MF-IS2]|uniref:Uncharacterized protein n=1 Tax=Macrolepiota fuliginosa MF-IS2 TaxID=1400762 RepID=A0A9P5XPW6_9AGAR|nr:hypothetical protein P691DRAFT_197029 [Macrolepiota fuliginosa MF-IS2]
MILENGEYDLTKLFALIAELGESLNENRSLSVSLYAQATNVKVCRLCSVRDTPLTHRRHIVQTQAIHSQSGYVLRRFNLDKTPEEYKAELERMNVAITAENQGLQHDNKQLSSLIKEYEQTLETVMSAFRNRARDVQERELSLVRDYETELLSREEENATQELVASTAISASLGRLSHVLRRLLRAESGEDDEEPPSTRTQEEEEEEPWNATLAAEHSMDREIELARLQAENEELKQMLGLLPRRMPESRLQGDYRPMLNLTRDGKYVPYGRGPPRNVSGGQDP